LCSDTKEETIVGYIKGFSFTGVAFADDGGTGYGLGEGIDFVGGCFEVAYFVVDLW
jgi:hypothetical protein